MLDGRRRREILSEVRQDVNQSHLARYLLDLHHRPLGVADHLVE
jgi:hypothetical protein